MSIRQSKFAKDLTQGPLLSQVLLFSLPIMLTSVLQLLFNTADRIVVGRWGGATPDECESALAAVGSCGSLIHLFVNVFIGLSVGAGICAAHRIGAKDYEGVKKVVQTVVPLASLIGTGVMIVGMAAAGPMLSLMNTDPRILDAATMYMIAYFAGTPANMVYVFCAALLRSDGDTVHPLIFLSSAGIVNVFLNLLMVLVFHLGAVGVGIATAVSQWVACVLILWYMKKTDGVCHLDFRQMHMEKSVVKEIIRVGLPAGIQSSLFSLSNILIQSSINSFGKTVVAGNTAAGSIEEYVYMCVNSLYHTAMTFVSQCRGARQYRRMYKAAWTCLLTGVLFGLVFGVSAAVFGRHLLAVFLPDNDAAAQSGMIRLYCLCCFEALCGLQEIAGGILRGMGRPLLPMVTTLIGTCLFRVLWILIVFRVVPELQIVYMSYPISWTLTASAHFVSIWITSRKFRREEQGLQTADTE
ncbi:MAG: MATE family efflux transporter [Clostridia bacterium]|nr:MATE family efflux transporter [Clostridia bacterium]